MSTGFTPEQRAATLTRDGNMCAMECNRPATEANHRLNRKAGGSRLRNGMSNACAICDICNVDIESDADIREEALRRGVKLEEGQDPSTTALWSPFYRQWILPGDDDCELLGLTDPTMDARAQSFLPRDYLKRETS